MAVQNQVERFIPLIEIDHEILERFCVPSEAHKMRFLSQKALVFQRKTDHSMWTIERT